MNRILFIFLLAVTVFSLTAQDRPDALVLYNAGKYAESEAVCRQELIDTPRNMNSFTVLGWALLKQNKFEEALKVSQEGLAIARYDNRIIKNVAEALFRLGRNKEALGYFQQFAAFAPPTEGNLKIVYYFMGEIYLRFEEYNNADMSFSTALHFDSNRADWWSRLGYSREMKKDYKNALEAYEKSLTLDATLSDAQLGKRRVEQLLNG
ncbi:MAG: tetratricopeptide repeat protein [Spirochaetales bacterium]|nr:tetratricopeptide repeat protein [Spirochaetales bacterium]